VDIGDSSAGKFYDFALSFDHLNSRTALYHYARTYYQYCY
jgi:hypothetical protein